MTDEASPAMQAENLSRHYLVGRVGRGLPPAPTVVPAFAGISFAVTMRRTLAVVGEAGSGKSTLARVLSLIEPPSSGVLRIDGSDMSTRDIAITDEATRRLLRRRVQMLPRDPLACLNPRKTIAAALDEPLARHLQLSAVQRSERVRAMFHRVGLRPEHAQRYPHMFSGGERQRVGIARALMLGPASLVVDEATSALTFDAQARILDLLMDLQQALLTACVFMSRDLAVAQHLAHEVLVMHRGSAVEQGPTEALLGRPLHPYTQALVEAARHRPPDPSPRRRAAPPERQRPPAQGKPPTALAPPSGCSFHPRCPWAQPRCRTEAPLLRLVDGRRVACHVVQG